jgi:hypothetical protein
MYDKKHKFLGLSPIRNENDRTFQKGIREKLLCEECEQKLSIYEKYVRGVLYGGVEIEVSQDGRFFYLQGLDYKKIRIFYLSILWRMGVASHFFFQDVDLGPHEEKMRKMVLDEKPGEPDQYGFICIAALFDDNKLGEMIIQPHFIRLEQHRVYRVLIGGLLYFYFVSSHKINEEIAKRFIQKNGKWTIYVEKIRNIDFLDKLFTQLSRKRKQNKF